MRRIIQSKTQRFSQSGVSGGVVAELRNRFWSHWHRDWRRQGYTGVVSRRALSCSALAPSAFVFLGPRVLAREIRFPDAASSLDAVSWWSLHGHAPRYCVSNQLFSRVIAVIRPKGHVLIEADKVNYLLLILAGPHTRNSPALCNLFDLQHLFNIVHVSAKCQIKLNRATIVTFWIFH